MACSGPNMRDERGFTLVELLVAMAVLGVGLVAVASGFSYGLAGVEAGKQQTTATFLAEHRLEQVKGTAFASITAATFPAEDYGAITGAPSYRRTVSVTDTPGGVANTKLIEVAVFYRPVTGWGVLTAERQVRLSTLMANR